MQARIGVRILRQMPDVFTDPRARHHDAGRICDTLSHAFDHTDIRFVRHARVVNVKNHDTRPGRPAQALRVGWGLLRAGLHRAQHRH
jgi:hypothetical protein